MHKLSDAELDELEAAIARSLVGGDDIFCYVYAEELSSVIYEIRESRKSESTHGAHRIANAVQGKGSV